MALSPHLAVLAAPPVGPRSILACSSQRKGSAPGGAGCGRYPGRNTLLLTRSSHSAMKSPTSSLAPPPSSLVTTTSLELLAEEPPRSQLTSPSPLSPDSRLLFSPLLFLLLSSRSCRFLLARLAGWPPWRSPGAGSPAHPLHRLRPAQPLLYPLPLCSLQHKGEGGTGGGDKVEGSGEAGGAGGRVVGAAPVGGQAGAPPPPGSCWSRDTPPGSGGWGGSRSLVGMGAPAWSLGCLGCLRFLVGCVVVTLSTWPPGCGRVPGTLEWGTRPGTPSTSPGQIMSGVCTKLETGD